MRIAVTLAVLFAVVGTALVAVCQHSETRRLQYRVWQLERRRERLERTRQQLGAAIEAERTPRRLLQDRDWDFPRRRDQVAEAPSRGESTPGAGLTFRGPPGFEAGSNFEGGEGAR